MRWWKRLRQSPSSQLRRALPSHATLTHPTNDGGSGLKPLHFLAQPFEIHKHKKGTVLENSAAVNGPVMMRELTKEEMETLVDLAGAPRSVLQGK